MNRTAYVTGADRGLGLALTEVLLEKGYRVFAGTYMTDWPELPKLAEAYPNHLIVLSLDVSVDASVAEAAKKIGERTSSLDLLINNAAVFPQRSNTIFEQLYFEDMKLMYNVNTLGPLRVSQSVIQLLLQGSQKMLVTISSEAGSIADNWRIKDYGYAMSKAAVNMQSAILQKHLAEFGLKVLAFHPGYMRSYMSGTKNMEATYEPRESAEDILRQIELNTDLNGPIYIDHQGKTMNW